MNKWVHLFRIKTTDYILCAGVPGQWLIKFFRLQTDSFFWIPTDLLKGRNEELKPDHYLRKSPSLESLSKPPMAFSSRMLSSTPSCLKPQSKLRYQPSFLGKKGQTKSITWNQDKLLNLEDLIWRISCLQSRLCWLVFGNYQTLLDPNIKIQIVMIMIIWEILIASFQESLSCTQEFHNVYMWSALIILLSFCMLWWAKTRGSEGWRKLDT